MPCQNHEIPKGKLYNAYNTYRARMAQVGLIIRRFQKGRSRPIEISDEPLAGCSNDFSNEAPQSAKTKIENATATSSSAMHFSKLDKFVPQIKLEIYDSNYNGSSTSTFNHQQEHAFWK